jgi:hypothetical protein
MIAVPVSRSEATAGIRTASFLEVWMHACLLGGYATCRVIDQHHFEEVETSRIEVCAEGLRHIALPFRKRRLEIWERSHARPFLFSWCTEKTIISLARSA